MSETTIMTAQSIAADVAECVRAKVMREIQAHLDRGMVLVPYANEHATSSVINEYMGNPSDILARNVAMTCCQWPAKSQTGEQVVAALRKSGVDASWEYPGYIAIDLNDGSKWAFGTAEGFWGGDLTDKEGRSEKGVELVNDDGCNIANESTDVESIREAILEELDRHNKEAGTSTKQC